MSVYLLYFESAQYPSEANYKGFDDVGKYVAPDIFQKEDVTALYKGKKRRATIFFDGVSSGAFYFFGKNEEGKKGELYRDILKEFILSRLSNKCVHSFLYLDIFDGAKLSDITLPDRFDEIAIDELDEKIFKKNVYKGFFKAYVDER
ncbi:MAG: hypothetical protein LBO72_09240 [Helicobacteraceae bacterium]|jgi:hypothetical protein|nr:hypothetical protein [Helicobacteraceae bacterium]